MATILLVNDERILRTLVAAGLRRWGYDVLEAAGARKAFRLAARRPVDLLIAELSLPGCDGLELARRVRRIAPATEVLFLARAGSPEPLERQAREGGFAVLREPFAVTELLGLVSARLPEASPVRKPPSSSKNDEERRRLRRSP